MSSALKFSLLFSGGVSSSLSGAIRGLSTDTKGLNRRIGDLNRTAGKIGEYRQLTAELNKLRTKMDEGGAAGAKAQREWEKGAVKLREMSAALSKAGVKMNDLGASERKLARNTAILTSQMGHLNRAAQFKQMREGAFSGWSSLIAPVLALAAPIKAAVEFEEKMSDIKKVVNFDTPKQFKEMGEDILLMSTRIPMAASGLADIIAAAGQSGIARDELKDFAETAAKMGVAFDLSGAEAGATMASWRAGMGLNQARVTDLADAVNFLSNNMNATAPAISEVIRRQGAVAMSAGLTEIQVAALSAAFLSAGASPEVAATAMKNFTGALTKGGAATKAQKKVFRELGLDVTQVAKDMQTDAQGTIIKVLEAISKVDEYKRGALVSQLFGEESKGAIMPLLANLDNLNNAFDLTADQSKYAGSMLKEYLERSATTGNSLELLRNGVKAAGITFGDFFLPALRETSRWLGKGLVAIVEFKNANPELAEAIAKTTAALLAGGIGFKILAMGAKFVYGGLGEALSLFRFFNVALMASPVFWIAAGLLAVGVALWKLGVLRPMVEGVWSSLKAAVPLVRDALAPGFKAFKDAVAPLGPMLTRAGDSLNIHSWSEFGRLIGDVLGFAIVGTAENIGKLIKGVVWLGQSIGDAAGWVSVFVEDGIAKIGSLATAVHTKATGIYTSIKDNWNLAISFLSSINLYDVGAKIVNSLIEGIKALGGKLTAAFYDILPDFVKENSTVREMLGIDLKGAYGGARAGGGPVQTGKFYTVGEKGPELFAPSSAGKIIPNAGAAPTRRKTRDNFQHLEDTFADEPSAPTRRRTRDNFQHLEDTFADTPTVKPSAPVPAARPMPKAAAATKSVPNLAKRPSANPAAADMARRWQAAARPSAAPMPSGPRGGGASGGGGGITVNMTVNVNGSGKNAGEIKQAASEALAEGREKLKRSLEGLLRNERRLSFG